VVRERLALPWSQADRFQFETIAAAHRAAGPLLPQARAPVRPTYLKYRREALERQGFRAAGRRMTGAALLERALTSEVPADSDHILDAALALAAASGLRHLTMDDIAAVPASAA